MKKVYMYKRFERFWHWFQALLIFFLALTGFEIHGSYSLFGYETAAVYHVYAGVILCVLFVLSIFWHFTTGNWRAYKPTQKGLMEQIQFYAKGIFTGAAHPYHKHEENGIMMKLNPLQRLSYLAFMLFMMPVMLITGVIYIFVADGTIAGEATKWLSIIHTFVAFMILAFVIAHVYMTTNGETILSDTKAMITGYENLEDEEHKA